MNPSVLVDTSIWIDAFRHPNSEGVEELKRLIKQRQVSVCGVVVAELLQGSVNADEFQQLEENLKGLPFLEADANVFRETGRLSFQLRKRGRTIPLTDALIACLAIRHRQVLWTRDVHFKGIPGLELKTP